MKRIFLALALSVIASGAAHGYEFERARGNMAQDLIACMSYYNWWALADRKDGRDPARMEYNARWALTLAKTYAPEMAKLDAMSDLSVNLINKLVKEEGSARLVLVYADSCKSMLEHPTERMQNWLDMK